MVTFIEMCGENSTLIKSGQFTWRPEYIYDNITLNCCWINKSIAWKL